jgi:hypothetical protein
VKTLGQKMKSIGASRRKKIEARATGLIAEEMTLIGTGTGSQTHSSRDGQDSRHQLGWRFPSRKSAATGGT